tara:strand:- start:15269 stop:15646 length:378 start_codon:yes stop_codon:yes gene_type:complete
MPTSDYKYFKLSEFDSPDIAGSGIHMSHDFMLMLEKARSIAKIPFKITSGYRSINHNKKVGGVATSSHTKTPCVACDIYIKDSRSRHIILHALIEAGFNRIGIGSNFIHIDIDKDKTENLIWTYN